MERENRLQPLSREQQKHYYDLCMHGNAQEQSDAAMIMLMSLHELATGLIASQHVSQELVPDIEQEAILDIWEQMPYYDPDYDFGVFAKAQIRKAIDTVTQI